MNELLEFIKIIVTTFSLAFGWIESPLFEQARKFVSEKLHPYLTFCYHCVGFYAGLLAILLNYLSKKSVLIHILYDALFLSGFCLILYRLLLAKRQ